MFSTGKGTPHPWRLNSIDQKKGFGKNTSAKQKDFTKTNKLRDAKSTSQEFVSGRKNLLVCILRLPLFGAPSFKQEPCIFIILGHCSRTQISQTMERQNALTPRILVVCRLIFGGWLSHPNSIGNTWIANVYKHLHIYTYLHMYRVVWLFQSTHAQTLVLQGVCTLAVKLSTIAFLQEKSCHEANTLPIVYTLNSSFGQSIWLWRMRKCIMFPRSCPIHIISTCTYVYTSLFHPHTKRNLEWHQSRSGGKPRESNMMFIKNGNGRFGSKYPFKFTNILQYVHPNLQQIHQKRDIWK